MAFIPRGSFPFPSVAPTWYIGHMQKGLRRMKETLANIDLVLEVRDARLPLTSVNPAFEKLFGSDRGLLPKNGKKRLVVYNKRDLAEPALERPIQRALLQHAGQLSMFTDTRSDQDVRRVLKTAIKLTEDDVRPPDPSSEPYDQGLRFLIAGMPNVGKSSLLNSLRRVGVRKGKAAQVGPDAGITRKLTGTVRVWDDPITYVYDTPGVMIPYFGEGDEAIEKGLKLALTSGLKESLYDPLDLADYLLYRLNMRYFNPAYPTPLIDLPIYLQPFLQHLPTNDIHPLLHAIGTRVGALRKGGVIDEEFAAKAFIRAFREGKLGLWALDDMGLLLRGNENTAQLPSPDASWQQVPKLLTEPARHKQNFLPEPEVDKTLALIQANSSLPAIIAPDSQTSLQISSFISSHFEEQRLSLTQLSSSKTQVKKRARIEATEGRKRKWREKYPNLATGEGKGIGRMGKVGKSGRQFFVGGNRYKRRLEKGRSIARKVDRNRAKKRNWS